MAPTFRLFRYTMVACGPVMITGGTFVAVRLAPLHFRHGAAMRTLWPLAASGLATTFEAAVIIAIPVGFALALKPDAVGECHRPTGRSADPMRWLLETLLFAAALLFATATVGGYANSRLTLPGRVARGLVQSARQFCEQSNGYAPIPIPTLRARWVCSPPSPPRLVGELSKSGAAATYSALGVEVSEDLAHIDLTEFNLSASDRQGRPALHLSATEARLRGVWPWPVPQRLSGIGRAVYSATIGTLLGLLAALLAYKLPNHPRWFGPTVASAVGFGTWLMIRLVDTHSAWSAFSYIGVPLVSGLAMGGAWILFSRTRFERQRRC